ncbi:MAG: hypothetical protein WCF44_04585, partial [Candidatus Methylophosphatis roskildensis]
MSINSEKPKSNIGQQWSGEKGTEWRAAGYPHGTLAIPGPAGIVCMPASSLSDLIRGMRCRQTGMDARRTAQAMVVPL